MQRVNIPIDYIPSESEDYMNSMHKEYFLRQLEARKATIIREYDSIMLMIKNSQFKTADEAQDQNTLVNSAINLRRSSRLRNLLLKINNCIEKIYSNSYGYCEITGEKIGIARLCARPTATMVVDVQQKKEDYKRQHKKV